MTTEKLNQIAKDLGLEVEVDKNYVMAWDKKHALCLNLDDDTVNIIDENCIPIDVCNWNYKCVPMRLREAVS